MERIILKMGFQLIVSKQDKMFKKISEALLFKSVALLLLFTTYLCKKNLNITGVLERNCNLFLLFISVEPILHTRCWILVAGIPS